MHDIYVENALIYPGAGPSRILSPPRPLRFRRGNPIDEILFWFLQLTCLDWSAGYTWRGLRPEKNEKETSTYTRGQRRSSRTRLWKLFAQRINGRPDQKRKQKRTTPKTPQHRKMNTSNHLVEEYIRRLKTKTRTAFSAKKMKK